MAQHIPIQSFSQKQMRQVEKSIREQRYFKTSMKFERLDAMYNETPSDEVYHTQRRVPQSLTGWPYGSFEVHTEPAKDGRGGREVTNIYFVA